MLPFATEFPVRRSGNKAAFAAEVFTWLRGIRNSTVLSATSEHELDGENVVLVAASGEELRMRELKRDGDWEAIGFRHDMPDDQGRIWRTEAVLKRGKAAVDQDVIRFRTQCLAKRPGAFLQSPKKPFLIKSLLKNGWGGNDNEIEVCDEPIWLEDRDDDVAFAEGIILGSGSKCLPVIYISASGHGEWLFTRDEIEKLAYDLGGVAHVVIEPSRKFSFQLRDRSNGRNVYGGSVGVALPNQGFIRRLFLGNQFGDVGELLAGLRTAAVSLRGYMPSEGWDWTDFQEHALREQRATLRGSLSEADANQLLDDYAKQLDELQEEHRLLMDDLQEENRQLKQQLNAGISDSQSGLAGVDLLQVVSKEVYPGELMDRIRLAAQTAIGVAEANGIDERSVAVWTRIIDCIPRSPALDELLLDLSRATKDPKRMADEVTGLLERHGYRGKSDNKHIKLEAQGGFFGLQSITLSKTPSDNRGLKNQRKQIERTLGISKLPGDSNSEE